MRYYIEQVNPLSYSLDIPTGFVLSKEKPSISGESIINITADEEENKLSIVINFSMYLDLLDSGKEKTKIFTLSVENIFIVENISQFLKIGEVQSPDAPVEDYFDEKILNFFIRISTHQTRGVQAVYTKGTPIAEILIPLDGRKVDSSGSK